MAQNGKREADYATNHQPENCECQEDMLLQPPTGNGLRGRTGIVAGASCLGPGKIKRRWLGRLPGYRISN